MSVTVFTTGSVEYGKAADGADVLRIEFDTDESGSYQRHELPSGTRIDTNGALSESFRRDGAVLEVIGLGELQARFGDEKVLAPEASGSCRMTYDEHGLTVCDQGTCSGSCTLKSIFGIFHWCSCG
jgi:hypothetical protein